MSATITAGNGAGTTSPLTVLSPYATAWASRNVIHDLIGGDIAVALVTPRPRSGTLELLYPTAADAYACVALHQQRTTFTLSEPDVPQVAMVYVVDGELAVALDEATRTVWVVSVGFQEVTP